MPRSPPFDVSVVSLAAAAASGAMCMLSMMRGTLSSSALPCSVCGIGTQPCSVLLKTPCSWLVHVAA